MNRDASVAVQPRVVLKGGAKKKNKHRGLEIFSYSKKRPRLVMVAGIWERKPSPVEGG